MRRLALLLVFLAPLAAFGQGIVSVPPQQCVWRAGDNPAWAAPNLDESGWQPYAKAQIQPSVLRLWIRCRADLSSLRGTPNPAIQVGLFSAYQLYLDGGLLGEAGNLVRGDFTLDSIRSYPVSASPGPLSVIALRVTRRNMLTNSGPLLRLLSGPLTLRAGDAGLLAALRSQQVLSREFRHAKNALCFGVVGVLAVLLIGLYAYDRSRYDFLLLSLCCLSLAALRINEFAAASLVNYSYTLCVFIMFAGNFALTVTEVPFFYAFVRRRVPPLFWILMGGNLLTLGPVFADILLGAQTPAWLVPFNRSIAQPASLFLHALLSLAPFFAFWPFSKLSRRNLPVAALCMIWGIADVAWFAIESTALRLPGIPNLFAIWGGSMLEVRGIATACVLAALLGLLFRDQRQVTEERAALAGEMQAAGEIQQMLVPARIESAPGVRIEVAFYPMREVGGDFYQVIRRGDNSTLVVIGDVSGKGLRAAMTGTLAVGVVRTLAAEDLEPAPLLTRMNREMAAAQMDGFITCLCVLLSARGEMAAANAGHLSPYRNGEEMVFPSSLPVGIAPETEYTQHTLTLAPGDTLTFLSDGIVEAQSPAGELFGFDRTRAISTQTAEEIARAALRHGQQDDITVLTLQFTPAEVLHA